MTVQQTHTRMVCGFLFTQGANALDREVLLMLKNRPTFQAGKYNGIGGKCLPGESPETAMAREAFEEGGIILPSDAARPWTTFARLSFGGTIVDFLFAVCTMAALKAHTVTDEPVGLFVVGKLPPETLYNCRWLIPLALDFDRDHDPDCYMQIFTGTHDAAISAVEIDG